MVLQIKFACTKAGREQSVMDDCTYILPVVVQCVAVTLAWTTTGKQPGVTTGSAVALHCCKDHAKINRNIEKSTPCKIVTHEDFNLKLDAYDYVVDITRHAT